MSAVGAVITFEALRKGRDDTYKKGQRSPDWKETSNIMVTRVRRVEGS